MASLGSATNGRRRHPAVSAGPLFRRAILAATHHRAAAAVVRRHGMRLGAGRFVAGETLDECVPVLRRLNGQGLRTNTTMLGEGVRDEKTIAAVVDGYRTVLDRIAAEGLTTNLAVKPTQLGLDVDEALAYRNLAALAEHAGGLGNFVRLDMEESARVGPTLRLYRRLRADGHENVGTVLQSALYRTVEDLAGLEALRPNLRLVKGAYLEAASVAYQAKPDVDRAYRRLAERMLGEIGFVAIATHDERIIDWVLERAGKLGIGFDRFEIQMLYGVRPGLQRDLVAGGARVLVATPFGPEWYFYLIRRLAERPANLLFFGRALLKR